MRFASFSRYLVAAVLSSGCGAPSSRATASSRAGSHVDAWFHPWLARASPSWFYVDLTTIDVTATARAALEAKPDRSPAENATLLAIAHALAHPENKLRTLWVDIHEHQVSEGLPGALDVRWTSQGFPTPSIGVLLGATRPTWEGDAFRGPRIPEPGGIVPTAWLELFSIEKLGNPISKLDDATIAQLPEADRAVFQVLRYKPLGLDSWVRWAKLGNGWLVHHARLVEPCVPFSEDAMSPRIVAVVIAGELRTLRDGVESCRREPVRGRRPPGLVRPRVAAFDPVAADLAEAAHLEAASVLAFQRLADELAALGAPRSLVERSRAAARDEVRHADVMARFARRAGAEPPPVETTWSPARDAFAVALDNAVEGCVLEAFAAVTARFDAALASCSELAAALDQIAEDEGRHADLAWDIAAWLEPQLSSSERAAVGAARSAALATLGAPLATSHGAAEVLVTGFVGHARERLRDPRLAS